MSRAQRWVRGAALLGVAGGLAGAGYALERVAAARVKKRHDIDDDLVLGPLALVSTTIPGPDGGTISYVDTGPCDGFSDAATVVLAHGVTLSVRTWVRQLDALPRAGLRVIAYDQRGHGGSELGQTGHSVANLGDDLAVLLEHLALDDVVLVGHSMGGIAVQSFVARHPDAARARLRGIILLSTLAATLGGSQAAQLNAFIERVTRRTPDSTRLWATPNLGLLMARVGFGSAPIASHVELVRQMMLACTPTTRTDAPRSLIGFDLTAELSRIDIPTVVVCGTNDVITPPANARLLHNSIAGSRLEMLEGGGHMLMLERADDVNALIADVARKPHEERVTG